MPSLMHRCTAPTSPRRLLHSLGHYLLYRVQIAYFQKYVIGNYFAFGSRSNNCQSWKKLRGYTSHLVKLPLQNDIQHRTRQTCVLVKTNKEVSILISTDIETVESCQLEQRPYTWRHKPSIWPVAYSSSLSSTITPFLLNFFNLSLTPKAFRPALTVFLII